MVSQNVISADSQKNIDEKLVRWIIRDSQSFNIVENPPFIDFVNSLNENYKLINRKQVCTYIHQLYESKLIITKQIISNINSKISISFDIWTSNNQKSYLGLKMHYINEVFELKSFTLDFYYFNCPHSGNNLCSVIQNILNSFNIGNLKSITCDNASNNVKCFELLKKQHTNINFVGCFAHILNLIIKAGPLRENTVIEKIRRIADKANNSGLANILNKEATIHSLPYSKLIMDVVTRWNSTYLMINSFVKNEKLLKILSETNTLTELEWLDIKKICNLLEPFYEITQIISSSKYPTIGFCYSIILEIENIINKFNDDDKLKGYADLMKTKFLKYFSNVNDDYAIAMFLDPRIKDKKFTDHDKLLFLEKFKKIYLLYENKHSTTVIKNLNNKCNLYDSFFPRTNDSNSNEIFTYLYVPLISKDSDILQFWNNNKEQYTILSIMARDYLCIPATSVNCEEMFSAASDVVTKKRNQLSPKIIKEIMCLQSWLLI
ncbi:MAG: hAT transposon family protein [Chitinophagaceae bacterium]